MLCLESVDPGDPFCTLEYPHNSFCDDSGVIWRFGKFQDFATFHYIGHICWCRYGIGEPWCVLSQFPFKEGIVPLMNVSRAKYGSSDASPSKPPSFQNMPYFSKSSTNVPHGCSSYGPNQKIIFPPKTYRSKLSVLKFSDQSSFFSLLNLGLNENIPEDGYLK